MLSRVSSFLPVTFKPQTDQVIQYTGKRNSKLYLIGIGILMTGAIAAGAVYIWHNRYTCKRALGSFRLSLANLCKPTVSRHRLHFNNTFGSKNDAHISTWVKQKLPPANYYIFILLTEKYNQEMPSTLQFIDFVNYDSSLPTAVVYVFPIGVPRQGLLPKRFPHPEIRLTINFRSGRINAVKG